MYPEGKPMEKAIGVVLLASSFYVKKVINASDKLPFDKKQGCTIPWHRFGIRDG